MLVRALAALLRPVARRIVVDGVSMIPTYRPGEYVWAVRRWRSVRVHMVVVTVLPGDQSEEIMKRVERVSGREAWIVGDNTQVSTDSRTFGSVPTRAIRWVVLPQRPALPKPC